MEMTESKKATYGSEVVEIIGVEHKSSFGDLLKIRLKTGEEKVVLSNEIKNIKQTKEIE